MKCHKNDGGLAMGPMEEKKMTRLMREKNEKLLEERPQNMTRLMGEKLLKE